MRTLPLLVILAALLASAGTRADDDIVEQKLEIKNHVFVPQELTVPQGKKVRLTIVNEDATPAEFESFELHREKVVDAHGTITVFVGPLDPGTYPFFDDFHHYATTGSIVAK